MVSNVTENSTAFNTMHQITVTKRTVHKQFVELISFIAGTQVNVLVWKAYAMELLTALMELTNLQTAAILKNVAMERRSALMALVLIISISAMGFRTASTAQMNRIVVSIYILSLKIFCVLFCLCSVKFVFKFLFHLKVHFRL